MSTIGNLLVRFGVDISDFEKGISQAEKRTGGFSSTVGSAAKAVAVGTAAMGAAALGAGAVMYKVGADFDKAFDNIRIGTGASGDALEGLKDDFKAVFSSVPTDMMSASSAVADFNTLTGSTGDVLRDLSITALEAARLMGVDSSALIDSFGRSMNVFQVPAEQGAALLDNLFVISQNTGIGIDKLSSHMQKFGPIMSNAGFSAEEAALFFGDLHHAGVDITRVMPAMNQFTRKLAAEGVTDLKGAVLDTVEAIRNAESDTEALNIATEAFGAQGAQRMTNAIRNGALSFDELNAMIADTEGAILDHAAATESLGEKWTKFKNKALVAIQPVATAVFDLAGRAMDKLFPAIEKVGGAIGNFIGDIKWVIDNGAGFNEKLSTGVWADLAEAIGAVVIWLRDSFVPTMQNQVIPAALALAVVIRDTLMPPLTAVFNFFKENESALQALGVAVGTILVVAFTAWAVAAGAAAVATIAAAAPVIALVAVVGGLGAAIFLLIKHWDDITAKFPILGTASGAVQTAFSKLTGFITGTLIPAILLIGSTIGSMTTGAVSTVRTHWGTLEAIFTPPLEAALAVVTAIFDAIVLYIETAIRIVQGVIEVVMGLITGDWERAWEGVKDILAAVWDGITGLIDIALTLVTELLSIAWDVITSLTETAWGVITDLISGAWDGIKSLVSGAVDTVKETLAGAWGAITEAAASGWEDIKSTVVSMAEGMRDAIGTVIDEVVDWFRKLPGRIIKSLGNASRLLVGIGKAIIQGLWDGMKGLFGDVLSWAGKAAGDIVGKFTGVLKVFSPSRVMAEVGENVMLGLHEGMADTFDGDVIPEVERMTAHLIEAFRDGAITLDDITGNLIRDMGVDFRAAQPIVHEFVALWQEGAITIHDAARNITRSIASIPGALGVHEATAGITIPLDYAPIPEELRRAAGVVAATGGTGATARARHASAVAAARAVWESLDDEVQYAPNVVDWMERRGLLFARGLWSVPGTGSRDSFPALLAPGEMVVPAAIAERIRAGHMSAGSRGASLAGAQPSASGGGPQVNIHIAHQEVHGTDKRAAERAAGNQAWGTIAALRARGFAI